MRVDQDLLLLLCVLGSCAILILLAEGPWRK